MTLGEVKGQISLNFSYHVNFKDFLYQTLCVFSQMKDTKKISDGILILSSGSCPRGWTLGHLGSKGVIFFKHGHVAYQIDGDDKHNRMQVTFSIWGIVLQMEHCFLAITLNLKCEF